MSAWIERDRPDVMVVDVSIEIALLARLHGVPVVLVAQRGIRHDAAHALAYAQASAIAAPWTAATHLPGEGPPERLLTFTGAVSRFDGEPPPGRSEAGGDVLVLIGAGGHELRPEDVLAAARSAPHRRWHVAGALRTPETTNVIDHGPAAPVLPLLRACSVVVGTAGSNIVAEVAAARRPFVCLPQAEAVPGTGASGGGAPPAGRRDRVHATAPHIGVARPAARCGSATDGPVGSAARRSRGVAPCGGRPGCGVQRMRVAVATLARGRALHLQRQALAVSRLRPAPSAYVVLALDERRPDPPGATVLHRPLPSDASIRLGAARNEMIAAAAERADLVVCLDVDCLPAPDLLRRLSSAAAATRGRDLLAGPVGRLAPTPRQRLVPTPAERRRARDVTRRGPRPVAPAGRLVREPRMELFWSLSFAVTPETHARIGGFDERYEGYGAEDTDYGFRAREAGVGLVWVGGAWTYHQHHPVSTPPREHLDDIVSNSRRFHQRWGRWPMEGWLHAFARAGLVRWSTDGETIEAVGSVST